MVRQKGSNDKQPRTYFYPYHKRKENSRQQKKPVEEFQTVHFGHEFVGNTDKSYLVNLIKIGGEPNSGIVKCWNYNQTSVRVFMSLPTWFSLVHDVLPKLKYPGQQQQLGTIEEDPKNSDETYVFLLIPSPERISY